MKICEQCCPFWKFDQVLKLIFQSIGIWIVKKKGGGGGGGGAQTLKMYLYVVAVKRVGLN